MFAFEFFSKFYLTFFEGYDRMSVPNKFNILHGIGVCFYF